MSEQEPEKPGRLKRIFKKLWWAHSTFALSFGIGVMLFARAGLAYADKVMVALFASWLLLFVALRFITGPTNRRDDEHVVRKGMRVVTNYVIKQFYQQMFFFLTPLYASSATWALGSWNWWLAPLLLACGVLSTMDLVFDNFVMEHRMLASAMYGVAMFALLNVLLPLVAKIDHLTALVVAAGVTPAAVALLSFSIKQVLSPQGALLTLGTTGALLGGVWFGRSVIPPAPLAATEIAVGHGTAGSYECLPGSVHRIHADQLDGLRCGALLREPGGPKEPVEQVWTLHGHELARISQAEMAKCDDDGDSVVFTSTFPKDKVPKDPTGMWSCETFTIGGQLVGLRKFEVVAATPAASPLVPAPPATK